LSMPGENTEMIVDEDLPDVADADMSDNAEADELAEPMNG